MILYGKPQQLTTSSPQNLQDFPQFFLMYGRGANTKHMILAEETTKYLGDNDRCFKRATHDETITGCGIQLGKIKSSTTMETN